MHLPSRSYIPNSRVALVCSARSSHTKALGTTNLLLQASREALQPPASSSAVPQTPGGLASGAQTPFFPKRVGSGFFGGSASGSFTSVDDKPGRNKDASTPSGSLMSSVASLRELDISSNTQRSSSPSPFTPTGRRSPTSPVASGANGSGNGQVPPPSQAQESGFHSTVDTLKAGHLEAAQKTVRAGPLRDELEEEIERDCEILRSFLQAAQVS